MSLRWLECLADRNELIISPKVLEEILAASRKARAPLSFDDAETLLLRAEPWCRLTSSYAATLTALSLCRATGYQVHDCVLLATAYLGGCAWFLSEDMHHQRSIGTMTIVNPFLVEPEIVFAGR